MKKFLLFFVSLLLIASCAKKEGEQPKKADPGKQTGTALVKLNEIGITKDDIEKELQSMPEDVREAFLQDSNQFMRFLEDMANKEALHQEAVKKGIDKDSALQKKLEYYKKITIIQMLLEKELSQKVKVSDSEIKEYYKKNMGELASPEQIRLSHIMTKSEATIKKAHERIKKGEDFAKVAKELSEDKQSAALGGDLGSFEDGKMPPEFNNAIRALKKGDVSQPVKTEFGYHIIKVTDRKKGKNVDINNIKEDIRRVLLQEKQKEILDKYLQDIKKMYKVKINKAEVDKYLASKGIKDSGKDKAKGSAAPEKK
ncbi:MAG: peptidylprolyl isomerase [Thermodesulfovibrionales bacterium]|nr:peptidylprolyl isomerase [Thermodesulfovibrionales bacterium]